MDSGLPARVYSPDHLRFCLEELERYASALLRAKRGAHGVEIPELSRESAALLDAGISANEHDDPAAIARLGQGLVALLQSAPVVGVVLAAPAPMALKEELVAWLRANLTPTVLVEFHVDPDIAGGIVLRSINTIYDHSFRQHLLANPERFTRILEHV